MDQTSSIAFQNKSVLVTLYCYCRNEKQTHRWSSNYIINEWWHILKEEDV